MGVYPARMKLAQWVRSQGHGEVARLARVTELGYNTIAYLARGKHVATYANAALISAATGGSVSIAELCEPLGMRAKINAVRRRLEQEGRTV
jgi:hypothetical protein